MATTARGRRLEPDARREEILDGASRLFADRPYAAVSLVEVAREVGVARGLVNHYFGTKRALYLEVVRRLTTIPADAVEDLPAGSRADRAGAAVDWFLDTVEQRRGLWLAVGAGSGAGGGGDPDVDAVLAEADEVAVDRVVVALLAPDGVADAVGPLVRARLRSFFGLVRAASREWLVRGSLDRAQTRTLLVEVLLVVLDGHPAGPPSTSHV